jgi:hypothetical protein
MNPFTKSSRPDCIKVLCETVLPKCKAASLFKCLSFANQVLTGYGTQELHELIFSMTFLKIVPPNPKVSKTSRWEEVEKNDVYLNLLECWRSTSDTFQARFLQEKPENFRYDLWIKLSDSQKITVLGKFTSITPGVAEILANDDALFRHINELKVEEASALREKIFSSLSAEAIVSDSGIAILRKIITEETITQAWLESICKRFEEVKDPKVYKLFFGHSPYNYLELWSPCAKFSGIQERLIDGYVAVLPKANPQDFDVLHGVLRSLATVPNIPALKKVLSALTVDTLCSSNTLSFALHTFLLAGDLANLKDVCDFLLKEKFQGQEQKFYELWPARVEYLFMAERNCLPMFEYNLALKAKAQINSPLPELTGLAWWLTITKENNLLLSALCKGKTHLFDKGTMCVLNTSEADDAEYKKVLLKFMRPQNEFQQICARILQELCKLNSAVGKAAFLVLANGLMRERRLLKAELAFLGDREWLEQVPVCRDSKESMQGATAGPQLFQPALAAASASPGLVAELRSSVAAPTVPSSMS